MARVFEARFPTLEKSLTTLKNYGDIPSHIGKLRPIGLDDPMDFVQVLGIIYRKRNNLFHGHKSPDDEDDRHLVTLAYSILSPLLRPFVEQLAAQGAANIPHLSAS